MNKRRLIYPELSYKICGFCFYVHNQLGRYRNEKQYADALEEIFKKNKVNYERELRLLPSFVGKNKNRNIPDFIVEDKIVLDLKAKSFTTKEDYFQMKRYLDSSRKNLGLIINFRQEYLRPKRILRKFN